LVSQNDATWRYNEAVKEAGVREIRNRLSEYLRRVEKGETVVVTVHGRAIAELGPVRAPALARQHSRLEALVLAGVVRPPLEAGDPTAGWSDLRLAPGMAAELIEWDRGES